MQKNVNTKNNKKTHLTIENFLLFNSKNSGFDYMCSELWYVVIAHTHTGLQVQEKWGGEHWDGDRRISWKIAEIRVK